MEVVVERYEHILMMMVEWVLRLVQQRGAGDKEG